MKKGMVKVSVMYPNGEGKHFDMDYYTSKHIPLVGKLMGEAMKGATVEQGLAGGAPDSVATYTTMANMYFENVEAFQSNFGPHAGTIMGDLPNFTNIEPVIQVSEVVM